MSVQRRDRCKLQKRSHLHRTNISLDISPCISGFFPTPQIFVIFPTQKQQHENERKYLRSENLRTLPYPIICIIYLGFHWCHYIVLSKSIFRTPSKRQQYRPRKNVFAMTAPQRYVAYLSNNRSIDFEKSRFRWVSRYPCCDK